MWYPATITAAAAGEPITLSEVKAYTSIDFADDDALITLLIKGARAYAEKYCGTRLMTQTVAIECDAFADMGRFPEAPLQSVASIGYVDTDGMEQTLPGSVYAVRKDGLEPSIVLNYGQAWPTLRAGSRVVVTAVVGYATIPDDIKQALLLYVTDGYANRENGKASDWTSFDSLLCNHRRNP